MVLGGSDDLSEVLLLDDLSGWKHPISSLIGGCCLADGRLDVCGFGWICRTDGRICGTPCRTDGRIVGRIARFLDSEFFFWKEEHGNTQYQHLMVVVVLLTIEYLICKKKIVLALFS